MFVNSLHRYGMQELIDNVIDALDLMEFKYEEVELDEKGSFEGYASVFNNKDLGNDVIRKGAFTESLMKKKPKQIKLLYQHKTDQPIGVIDSIQEDNKGLLIKGRIAIDTQLGGDVYKLMKMGSIDSMSIGYRVNPDGFKYDDKNKRRILKSVDLMEVSMVTFPMNPKATVNKVKTIAGEDIAEGNVTERELEKRLRDSGILTNSLCTHTASILHKSYNKEQREVVDGCKQLLNIIKH